MPGLVDRVDEMAHQLEPLEAVRREELRRAAEEAGRGVHVGAVVGTPACRAEMAAGAGGERLVPVSELRAIA